MANIFTEQRLVDTQDKAVIKLTGRFDSTTPTAFNRGSAAP